LPPIGAKGVAGVDAGEVEKVISSIPADWMSEVMGTFVAQLVIENRRRLLT
jgi:hypothetical protein